MSEHEHAERAAAWLRAQRETVGPRPTTPPEPMIAAIADAIRAQARRRRARTAMVAGALGLVAGGAGLWLLHARTPAALPLAERPAMPSLAAPRAPTAPAIEAGTFTLALAGSAQLDAGGRAALAGEPVTSGHTLSSRGEPATLTGADGTVVHLEPRTDVVLVRADAVRWFQLQRGTFEAHVAKLAAGRRFVVATPDRQVEVRGTRFQVSLAPADPSCGDGTVTRVVVDEGVVTVRAADGSEDRVAAGERWPANCSTAARPHRSHPTERPSAPAAAPAAASASTSTSTLAAENDLFGRAARAQRAGDAATALHLLDDLLARYPGSPLRSAAETERARLLERTAK
jgi:ferric-dicitrate binding protein FerR (iron transport regulator)